MTDYTADQVIGAIEDFLFYGESKADPHNGSYFAGSGWAASCLRWHLSQLETAQTRQQSTLDEIVSDIGNGKYTKPPCQHLNLIETHGFSPECADCGELVNKYVTAPADSRHGHDVNDVISFEDAGIKSVTFEGKKYSDGEDQCQHDPITYTQHPSGDVVTKCRKCKEVLTADCEGQTRKWECGDCGKTWSAGEVRECPTCGSTYTVEQGHADD